MGFGGRRATEPKPTIPPPRVHEAAWLTPEAAAQVIGPGSRLGPLFAGVDVGGPPPSPEMRTRIDAFARANHVDIAIDVADDEVVAVRFAVEFAGCCGYEGADVLALRLGRPKTYDCCDCEGSWADDWGIATEDGLRLRAHVHVNRVEVRWERPASVPEIVERADGLIGTEVARAARGAGYHWTEILPGEQYMIEVPFPTTVFTGYRDSYRENVGIVADARGGKIVETSFALRGREHSEIEDAVSAMRARWGRPRKTGDDELTWRTRDRIVTAELDDYSGRVTIKRR